MKTKLGVLIVLITATVASAQTTNLTALLQQGLFEEQANRNLDAAIADYQTLAAQFDKDRQLAATAVFRLGECYRMQGKTNEAAVEYQRILRDFSDQTQLATLSRQDLTGMGIQSAQVASTGLAQQMELLLKRLALTEQDLADTQRLAQLGTRSQAEVRAAEREVLQLQQQLAALGAAGTPASAPEISDAKLWSSVKDLPPAELRKVLPTLMPDEMLTSLLEKLNTAEQNFAVMTNDYATNNLQVVRLKADLDTLNQQITDQIDDMMQALKMRAELSQPTVAASAPTDAEDQEIQRIKDMVQNSPDLINGGPLCDAVRAGQLRVATFLLDHGANADTMAANGELPLVSAASNGHKAMTELLLSRGADVNAHDRGGYTSLLSATFDDQLPIVELLLAHKADVNEPYKTQSFGDDNGDSPLHVAAERGYVNLVSLLLTNAADVNARNDAGETPVFSAIQNGQPQIVQMLLAAGANPNTEMRDGRTPLSFAAQRGSPEMVKMLLAAKADPNGGKLDVPLLCAIHAQDLVSAELLLRAGANPNTAGKLDMSGNFNAYYRNHQTHLTPLWLATCLKQLPAVRLLLKYQGDPNDPQTDGRPLLFSALSDTNFLEAMLDAGAKVDARDNSNNSGTHGGTPLDYAADQNNVGAVEFLLNHGADPNDRDAIGHTPLHYAAFSRASREVFELLLDHHADPNVRSSSDGWTPLEVLKAQLAANNMSVEQKVQAGQLADLLRQHGALDVLPDWDGITVSRPAANYSAVVFRKGTNDWNQVTLYDLLGVQYQLLTASLGDAGGRRQPDVYGGEGGPVQNYLTFPDFIRITIHRPAAKGTNWSELKINLARALDSGDCAADVPLQFGDVVEIPEADHVLGEPWMGLSTNELFTLKNCLTRHLQITVNGQMTNFVVAPQVEEIMPGSPGYTMLRPAPGTAFQGWPPEIGLFKNEPFMLWPVLENTKLLLASSDLSRVTVKRREGGKTREWTVDCSNPNSPPNFWLRDGDVIEVPEKR